MLNKEIRIMLYGQQKRIIKAWKNRMLDQPHQISLLMKHASIQMHFTTLLTQCITVTINTLSHTNSSGWASRTLMHQVFLFTVTFSVFKFPQNIVILKDKPWGCDHASTIYTHVEVRTLWWQHAKTCVRISACQWIANMLLCLYIGNLNSRVVQLPSHSN